MPPKYLNNAINLLIVILALVITSGCGSKEEPPAQDPVQVAQPVLRPTATLQPPPVAIPAPNRPQAIISSPTPNQQLSVGQPIIIISTAVDIQGVVRVDLVVNDQVISSMTNPHPQANYPFLVNQSWQPSQIGRYVIQVRAYNTSNTPGNSQQVFIEAIAAPPPTETLTATATVVTVAQEQPIAIPEPPTVTLEPPTVTPEPPTVTLEPPTVTSEPPTATPVPSEPYLIVTNVTNNSPQLNVHSGPSVDYEPVGHLSLNEKALILGQNDSGAGRWWQISFPAAPNGTGWVAANPEWVTTYNADNVAQVLTPPTPLPALTPTIASNQILFQEDFSTNAKGWRIAEENNDYSHSKQGLVNSQYQLSTLMAKQQVWETVALPQFTTGNFLLNFKATLNQAVGDFSSGSPAVVVSLGRNNNWYMLYFSNSGYKITSGNEQILYQDHTIHVDWTPHPAINLGPGITNNFSVLEIGSTITLYANGSKIVTVPDLTGGGPGPIRLHSYLRQANQSLTLDIDDVVVYSDPANVQTDLDFSADRTLITAGECVILRWQTNDVKEVYYQGQGVVGTGEQQECPTENRIYRLEVVKKDNTRETREIKVAIAGTSCADAGDFIADVNYPDGSVVQVGEIFTKTWRIKNTGFCLWDSAYRWRFSSEADNQSNFGHESFPFTATIAPDLEYEVTQVLTAPSTSGQYSGRWILVGPNQDSYTAWVDLKLHVGGIVDPTGCIDSGTFITDGNYPAGSTVAPGETFTKTWRIKNTGTCTWNNEYYWWFVSDAENGHNFGRQTFPFVGVVPPEAEYEIVQTLTAPTDPGPYVGQWRLLKRDREGAPVWMGVTLEVR